MGKLFKKLKLIEKTDEAKDTMTFKFEVPEDFSWDEGTHIHVAFDDFIKVIIPNKKRVRTLSIMTMENEGCIGFTTRVSKDGSDYKRDLLKLEKGDEMLMFKSDSRMRLKRESKPVVMISMGVGIATCRPLIKTFERDSDGVTKLININVDSSKDFVYREEIENLDIENFENYYVSSRKELYEKIDTTMIDGEKIYYVVGSDGFIKSMCDYLVDNKIQKKDIVIDKSSKKYELFL